MNKLFRIIQYYLILTFPFVLGLIVWQAFDPTTKTNLPTTFLQTAFGINLMLWFAVLIVYLISLIAFPSVREKTLSRLANLKERDEREQFITGRAARATYISTLSLTILLLFLSVFSITISKRTNSQTGKPLTSLGIGLHFSLLNKNNFPPTKPDLDQQIIFDSTQIMLSHSAIIFILLGWQLFIFNYYARKEQKQ